VELDRDGKLSLDKTKLTQALEQDYASVVNLFVDGTGSTGVAASLATSIDSMTDFADGLFKSRTDSMQNRISRIDDDIANQERSVSSYEELLNRKFTAMEVAIAQLQAQSGGLRGL
jgi:flagellar hook-associated protein 2